jgi:predicted O-linked N-acetylglucosamine transferase (SPINDLY family)
MTTTAELLSQALHHHQLGDLSRAAELYREILAIDPSHAEAVHFLGLVTSQSGNQAAAIEQLQRSIALMPVNPVFHCNLGLVYQMQGQLPQAEASFREGLRLDPDSAQAMVYLGHVLADQGRLEEAIPYFQQALRLRPDLAAAHAAMGLAFAEQGMADEAADSLEQALRQWPSVRLRIVLATLLPVIYQSLADLKRWRERLIDSVRNLLQEGAVLDLTEEPAVNLFYLPYQGCNDREIQEQVASLYRPPSEPAAGPPQRRNGKIKVGFISTYFRNHTIGHWTRGLVAQLARDDFDVTVLSVGNPCDEVADFFKQHCDRHVEVPKHLPTARRLIVEQQLDVLCYADIGMEPTTYTLAFSRLAPVQCVLVGHPVTTGIRTVDYFLSAQDLETEESAEHYSERLVRLKTLPVYFYRPKFRPPHLDRHHFGLSEQDHVYACTQSLFKFHADFDDLLAGILRGDPRGTLVVFQGNPHWDQLLRQRWAVTMPDVLDRVRFMAPLKFRDYLHFLAVADVLLDSIHFGGGSTSYEGLAVGTPIVTMPSQLLRGRITFALYKQMGVPDCVAASGEQYAAIALRLGTDPDYRKEVRGKILAANGVLFENPTGVRELERFFRQASKAE